MPVQNDATNKRSRLLVIIIWLGIIMVFCLLIFLLLSRCYSSDPFICKMSASWKELRARGLKPFTYLDVTPEVAEEVDSVGSKEFISRLKNGGASAYNSFDRSCQCNILTLTINLKQHAYLALTNDSDLTIEFQDDDEKDQVAPKLLRATVYEGWALP